MLTVSTASVDVTPKRALPLAGYAARKCVFERIDDRLLAELVLLEDADGELILVAGIDCLFVDGAFREALAAGCGLACERMILIATHTHNAPALDATIPELGACDQAWIDDVAERISSSVRDLRNGAKRTRVSCSWAQSSTTLAVSRRRPGFKIEYGQSLREGRFIAHRGMQLAPNPRSKVDANIRVIAMRDSTGAMRAVIWCFGAHPAFYPCKKAVSADFPGAVRDAIKERYGKECVALFFPGLAGSSIPAMQRWTQQSVSEYALMLLPFNPRLPSFSQSTYRDYVRRLSGVVCGTISSSQAIANVSHEISDVRLRSKYLDDIFLTGPGSKRPAPRLGISSLELAHNLRVLAFSGEMPDEWRHTLIEAAPGRGLLTAYAAGDATYVPPEKVRREGGYEAEGFMANFGLQGSFISNLDDMISRAVEELLR